MATVKAGTKFPTALVTELYNKVKGHSSVAKMIPSEPLPFNGITEFTFSMDNKISVVGESGSKPAGGAKAEPVVVRPIKVVYQSRVSDEFLIASEEAKLNYLKAFSEGFAKMLAEGMDEMILHGVNPASGEAASAVIGNNHLDYVIANYASGANVITYLHDSTAPDVNVDEAIAKLDNPNGVILGKTIRTAIAALNISGAQKYPEFTWGRTPDSLGGMVLDSNKSVEVNGANARAYVGNWNALKWGFAKEMPLKVIEYGNPDGAGDLQQSNEVVLRSEAYIGWGILDEAAFAMVAASGE